MLTESEIEIKAQQAVQVIEAELGRRVKDVFIIGSYANWTATNDSDLDFLVEFAGKQKFIPWTMMQQIYRKLPERVHVIYGTERAQQSMNKPYRRVMYANTRGRAN
jgi:predicted nucleotidyltransferase